MPGSSPVPRWIAFLMLSAGMFTSLAAAMIVRSRGFIPGSPPPLRAATVSSLIRRVNTLPRLASAAPFLCLIVCHLEWPDIEETPEIAPETLVDLRRSLASLHRQPGTTNGRLPAGLVPAAPAPSPGIVISYPLTVGLPPAGRSAQRRSCRKLKDLAMDPRRDFCDMGSLGGDRASIRPSRGFLPALAVCRPGARRGAVELGVAHRERQCHEELHHHDGAREFRRLRSRGGQRHDGA